jgi:DNA-binding GntR family transcriptional regulator
MLSRQHNLHNVAWAWYYHVKIAKAASCGDVAAAVEWMRIHIRRSQRDALARYAKALRQSGGRKTSRT